MIMKRLFTILAVCGALALSGVADAKGGVVAQVAVADAPAPHVVGREGEGVIGQRHAAVLDVELQEKSASEPLPPIDPNVARRNPPPAANGDNGNAIDFSEIKGQQAVRRAVDRGQRHQRHHDGRRQRDVHHHRHDGQSHADLPVAGEH